VTVSALADGSLEYAEPYYVTVHAMQRYRERVDGRPSDREIIRRVNLALQGAGPGGGYPPDRTLAIGVHREFVAVVEPTKPGEDMPAVVTIHGWPSPIKMRKRGGTHAPLRYYRWLNGGYQGRPGSVT